MAENKKSFVLYADLIHTVNKMPNDKAGELLKHILSYVNDKNPETDDLIIQLTFEPIKQQLKRDLVKYEQKKKQWSEAGKRSAEARKAKKNQQTLTDVKKRSTDLTVNDSVNVNVSVNDINNIYKKFVDEVKAGGFDSRVEAMYMRLKLRANTLTPLLKEYKLHLVEENRLHENTNDFFINFKNWLNVQDRIKKLDKYKI